jgi:phospholipid/cholesterol/gamma-HCH transport system permease protein
VKERLAELGRQVQGVIGAFGRITLFAWQVALAALRPPIRVRLSVNAVYEIGFLSLSLIAASGLAVGAVLGLQGYHNMARFGAEESLGAFVGLSLIRELGPVLTGLLVTGRAGSSIAAEISSMVTTEQLDGLRMMSVDPIHYVVLPKVVGMMICMPLLSAIFIVCAIVGGHLVGVELLGLDSGVYIASLEDAVDFREDVLGSIIKAFVFGISIGLVATYRGFTSEPTAVGVSRSTTATVVIGSVWILFVDLLITALWGV